MPNMPTWTDIKIRLKKAFDDNPILFIAVGAGVLNASAKLMSANTDRKREKTYRREVRRRERKDSKNK